MEVGYYRSSPEDFHKGHYQNVLKKPQGEMDSPEFSPLSLLRGEIQSENYIQPHYKESYRLAIDRLVHKGRDSYHEFLKEERMGTFLSEDELHFITANVKHLPQNLTEEIPSPRVTHKDDQSSSGTYWPVHSDVETPCLDLGWPEVVHENLHTSVNLLFHPPRLNNPTIKDVIRKQIQDARKAEEKVYNKLGALMHKKTTQVIGIVMDEFTDVDIFKEIVDASIRGVSVYIVLDDSHLKSFLKMAEDQSINQQHLKKMRLRTVKGPEYLCRSGAKFHGVMEQKFLLVDCLTAIYGSYSFAWSYEKIHLSMVQVITGHLVKSYDEEFRTLYAQSTVPAELSAPEGLFYNSWLHNQQKITNFSSAPKIGRSNQLGHSSDFINRKTSGMKFGTRDLKEEGNMLGPLVENDTSLHCHVSQFYRTESEELNMLKRHSYAGERQDGYSPHNIRPRASNWNITKDPRNGLNNYSMDNYLQTPQIYRGQNMRQSYNGIDKQGLCMQQNIPTLENTSKAFMRTWRIESYLKNPEAPSPDAFDYIDQFDTLDKAGSFMQGRMRSSLALRSTIPEQMEPNRRMNNSSAALGLAAAHSTSLRYSSMQWDPTVTPGNRLHSHEFMPNKQSHQILDDFQDNAGYSPAGNSYHLTYASLGRPNHGQIITNPDILPDDWQKRHSVADPRSNTEHTHEYSGHMYGNAVRTQVNRSTAELGAQVGEHRSILNEDQRSVSHYDVKSITDTKDPSNPIWQEPPSRTVSAAALDLKTKDLTNKSNNSLKNSSKIIKSLLNIPEKKENSIKTSETPSLCSGGSSDTITAEDEEPSHRENKSHQTKQATTSVKFSSKFSKPLFKSEKAQISPQNSLTKTSSWKKPSILEKNSKPAAENRSHSTHESSSPFEKRSARPSSLRRSLSQDKSKGCSKGEAAAEQSSARAARGQHENKLEKFFQRVGSLIHKSK